MIRSVAEVFVRSNRKCCIRIAAASGALSGLPEFTSARLFLQRYDTWEQYSACWSTCIVSDTSIQCFWLQGRSIGHHSRGVRPHHTGEGPGQD